MTDKELMETINKAIKRHITHHEMQLTNARAVDDFAGALIAQINIRAYKMILFEIEAIEKIK